MANKSNGKTYTSKGERKNVATATLRHMKASRQGYDKALNKLNAWISGKNPWVTVRNPNKNETNKLFIKVRYNDMKRGSYKDLEKKLVVS